MKKINRNTLIIAITMMIVGFGFGWLIFGNETSKEPVHEIAEVKKNQIWTCSMHPQIRQNAPGKCPICGMELIPVDTEHEHDNPLEIKMSQTAMQLANIQTSIVSRQTPEKEIRLTGKVVPDERNLYSQTSHISGRIEKLFVNYTGEYVSEGKVIAYVYSPGLVTAQEELFEAYKIRETQPALYNAAREKLKNWKLTDIQIDEIIEEGKPRDQFPVLSDLNGIVIAKKVNSGDYVKQGSTIYEVADLSRLWVLFDIHESEMPWIKVGDEVAFTVESIPGERFKGKISFIDPLIDQNTRVAKARVVTSNPGNRLKPEMFATGIVKSTVQSSGPSIIVPKTAVMWTGRRSLVYIKSETPEGISFMMREVDLGPSLGSSYLIKEGLSEGEEIATNGTFSIDAAAQLAGKASMMNSSAPSGPGNKVIMTGHEAKNSGGIIQTAQLNLESTFSSSHEVKQVLKPVIESYLQLKDALVNDDFSSAIDLGGNLQKLINNIDMKLFSVEAHELWMTYGMAAGQLAGKFISSENIINARSTFKPLSAQVIQIARVFQPLDRTLYIQHCPMADNFKGADWLSTEMNIKNPYYGESMRTCGEIKGEISNN